MVRTGVTPQEAAKALRDLCEYMGTMRPDKRKVASELRRIRDAIVAPRQAAHVDKFTKQEYEAAVGGLQALFDKIMKAAKTLNPQDPSRSELEQEASHLLQLKSDLAAGYKNIGKLNV